MEPTTDSRTLNIESMTDATDYNDLTIEQLHTLLASTPADQPARLAQLVSTSTKLNAQYGRHRSMGDLDKLIQPLQEATDRTPESDPAYPGRAHFLATAYIEKYDKKMSDSSVSYLHQAVSLLRSCLATTPQGHARRTLRLVHLGSAHFRLWVFRDRRIGIREV
jgi:hypothetical protein